MCLQGSGNQVGGTPELAIGKGDRTQGKGKSKAEDAFKANRVGKNFRVGPEALPKKS